MSAVGLNSDDPDYVEIWNNVFMQFDRVTMEPLPRPSVDTGMGLERMAMVMQGVKATYDTDLFTPIIQRTIALLGTDEADYRARFAPYRALADVVDTVVEQMGAAYPELRQRRAFILETVDVEERQFLRTLSGGTVKLAAIVEQLKASGGKMISGED